MGGIFLLYNARPNALRRVFVTETTRRNDAKLVARDATKIYIYTGDDENLDGKAFYSQASASAKL